MRYLVRNAYFKIMSKAAILSIIMGVFSLAAYGQCPDDSTLMRPVYSIYQVKAGSSHLTDTYLTPIKYSGWQVGFDYERLQAMKFSPEEWVMQMKVGVEADRTLNPVKNHTMWYGEVDFSWGMMRRWRLNMGFSAGIGGAAMLKAGCLYLDRSGNNPASAKGSVTIGATGYAAWQTTLGRIPVTLRYQASLPVIGAFFAPDYGELYYEIYLGNRSGLAHCAWWGNHLALDHSLTADLHLGSTTLRIGYAGNFYNTNINHTVTRIISHSAVIGVGGEWISLNPKKELSKATKIISATY